jgi:hypothetical protein
MFRYFQMALTQVGIAVTPEQMLSLEIQFRRNLADELKAKNRARQRRYYNKHKGKPNENNVNNVRSVRKVEENQGMLLTNLTLETSEKNSVYISNYLKGSSKETPLTPLFADFEEFWKIYPRKVEKKAAFKAYCKARKTTSKDEIHQGASRYAQNCGDDLRYVKHPAAWLNGERWNDLFSPKSNGRHRSDIPGII